MDRFAWAGIGVLVIAASLVVYDPTEFPLAFVILVVGAIGVMTARDAAARGKPGWLVGILVAFSGPIGMILWLIVRPNRITPPPDGSASPHPATPPTASDNRP